MLIELGADVNCASRKSGERPLHKCTWRDRANIAEVLLKHGADINAVDRGGNTALNRAAFDFAPEFMRFLLERRADPEIRNRRGLTPVMTAARWGYHEAVESLLRGGAKLDVFTAAAVGRVEDLKRMIGNDATLVKARTGDRSTPLHWAARTGQPHTVGALLDRGADIDATYQGMTPLHVAIQMRRDAVVFALIKKGADVNRLDASGISPLTWSAQCSGLEVAKRLLEKGAKVNVQDRGGWTPLMFAASRGREDFVKLLLEHGAEKSTRNKRGQTALDMATRKRRRSIIPLLADAGPFQDLMKLVAAGDAAGVEKMVKEDALLVKDKDPTWQTALHVAAAKGHLEVARVLMNNGADRAVADHDGNTPLHNAAWVGATKIVRLLLEKGVPLNEQNNLRMTPLNCAVGGVMNHPSREAALRLIEKGADVRVADKTGATPLHRAAEYGQLEICKRLVEKGADVNARRKSGTTPLHLAALSKSTEIARLLVEKGAKVDAVDGKERTPLFWVARWHDDTRLGGTDDDCKTIIEWLIKKGADVHRRDNDGRTPIWSVIGRSAVVQFYGKRADRRRKMIAELFIKHGAKVNAKDKSGKTALQHALKSGDSLMADVLRQHGAK